MTTEHGFDRRNFLRGAVATGIALPVAGSLASCAAPSGGTASSKPAEGTPDNPFGFKDGDPIDAVIFNGGYGIDYVEFAAGVVSKKFTKSKVSVKPSTQIAQELQPRFVGGNPPDLIDNSGAGSIGITTILDQLSPIGDVLKAPNYEGKVIADTLVAGVEAAGTYDGKFVVLNYTATVYALWYSASLFKANGWTVPTTWDEALALGEKAKAAGKYLFVWGKEAASYWHTFAMDSAIKEGGDEVRLALANLAKDAYSHPALQKVFTALETAVKNGYFVPGGAGTQFTAAQAKWSNDQQALLYPSGSWIENEMKKATKDGFEMMGAPVLSVSASPKLGAAAVRASVGEGFIIPSKAKNLAGGQELLRAMLSKDAAANFAKTKLAPTIVKDTVPADGFGSTALVSQVKLLADAGKATFDYTFYDFYGFNKDTLVVWNAFLSGDIDAAALTKGLQEIADKTANDSSIKKITFS